MENFEDDAYSPDHLSFSQVSMYMRCGKQYEYRYPRGLKVAPAGVLITGSSYHVALQCNAESRMLQGEYMKPNDVQEVFADTFDQKVSSEPEGVDWEDRHPGFYKDKGVMLTGLYAECEAPNWGPLAVEQYFEIPTAHEQSLIGYIDQIAVRLDEKGAYVQDHKFTGKTPASGKHFLQLAVYQLASPALAELLGNVPIIGSQIHAAVHGLQKAAIKVSEYPVPSEAELASVQQIVDDTIRAIKAGIFPPTGLGTWTCNPKYCGYFHMCQGKREF
ncbi:MAG: RecB family exonuclease [Minisyncoccota bacterium]